MELVYNSSLTKPLNPSSCDHCKTSRIKCDRHQPCQTCVRKSRDCTYNILKASKGSKRKRTSSFAQSEPSGVTTPSTTWTAVSEPVSQAVLMESSAQSAQDDIFASLSQQTELFQWPEDSTFDVFDYGNLLAPEYNIDNLMPDYLHFGHPASDGGTPKTHVNVMLVEKLLNLYVQQIHPSIPLLRPSLIYDGLATRNLTEDRHFGALVSAICAFISLQAPKPHQSREKGKEFLKEATRLFTDDHLGENPTMETALASLLIFGALWSLGSENAAWLRLQETLNLAKLLRLEHLANQEPKSVPQWLDKMYLLWGLMVIERVFAAGRSHELKIAYPTSQSLDRFWLEHEHLDSQEKRHAAALILLVKSFGQLDNQIMMCWRKKCGQSMTTGNCQILNQNRITITLQSFPEETSIQWQTILMPSLQAQSMPIETTTQQNDGGDVLLTSIWLQNRLWHLALTHNLLVVNHTNPLLRFDYAFELADRAIDVLKLMRMSGFEGHGQGLADKCYSIATDFLDISTWLAINFGQTSTERLASRDVEYTSGDGIATSTNIRAGPQEAEGSLGAIHLEDNPVTEHKRSNVDIANSFLGFFALFNNGNNGKFESYFKRYQKFMSTT